MRIVFDARSYFMRTGIARYTRGLAHALAASPGRHQWLFLISDHHQPDEVDFASTVVEVRQSHAPWLGGAAEHDLLTREAADWSANLFHAVFPPQALSTVPTITTVFDFSPFTHPELPLRASRRYLQGSADYRIQGFSCSEFPQTEDTRLPGNSGTRATRGKAAAVSGRFAAGVARAPQRPGIPLILKSADQLPPHSPSHGDGSHL